MTVYVTPGPATGCQATSRAGEESLTVGVTWTPSTLLGGLAVRVGAAVELGVTVRLGVDIGVGMAAELGMAVGLGAAVGVGTVARVRVAIVVGVAED